MGGGLKHEICPRGALAATAAKKGDPKGFCMARQSSDRMQGRSPAFVRGLAEKKTY